MGPPHRTGDGFAPSPGGARTQSRRLMCDTLCVRHAGGMWFAKNSDRHPHEAQVVESHKRRLARSDVHTQYLALPDAGAFAFAGSRPTWLWGCEHGVNEHGV